MQTGTLVVASDPDIEIDGTVDLVCARPGIAYAWVNADGTLGYEHDGDSEVFWDSMTTELRGGLTLFEARDGSQYDESEVAVRLDDGRLIRPTRLDRCEPQARKEALEAAAPELLAAAKRVLAAWDRGDLAAAVRELDAAVATAEGC